MTDTLERGINRLAEIEASARSPEAAARVRELRRRTESLLARRRESEARRGTLPCPECGAWGELIDPVRQRLRCPACGADLNWAALYAATGIWKLHVAFLILFGGGTLALVAVVLTPGLPGWIHGLAAVLALPLAVVSLPYWLCCARQLVWWIRQRARR